MSYDDHEWIKPKNADEMFCIDPKCSMYHTMQLAFFDYDSSTGVTEYVGRGSSCIKCRSEMRLDRVEPYEVLSEDYCVRLEQAIKARDWGSKEYQIYEQILELVQDN